MRVEKTVFISYRRTNAAWALAVYQYLNSRGYDVYFDYEGMSAGDFERLIASNIKARAHFVVLLTPSALERTDSEEDWLRREIEIALDAKRNIVPLVLEGFSFDSPEVEQRLTGKLAQLSRYNALEVPAQFFDAAMERMCTRYLNVPLDTVLHPVDPPTRQVTDRQKTAAEAEPMIDETDLTAEEFIEMGFDAEDPEDQARYFSEAIRLRPKHALAFGQRALARMELGDLEGALADYDEAIRLGENDATTFYLRGSVKSELGDAAGALEDFDEAIRLDPDDAASFQRRAIARDESGDSEGALRDYDESIRLDPSDSASFYLRATVRSELGDVAGALEDFDDAIRLDPTDAGNFLGRGIARSESGDLDGALQDYDECIRLGQDDAATFYIRGADRETAGDTEGARSDYEEALRRDPDYAFAREALELLAEQESW